MDVSPILNASTSMSHLVASASLSTISAPVSAAATATATTAYFLPLPLPSSPRGGHMPNMGMGDMQIADALHARRPATDGTTSPVLTAAVTLGDEVHGSFTPAALEAQAVSVGGSGGGGVVFDHVFFPRSAAAVLASAGPGSTKAMAPKTPATRGMGANGSSSTRRSVLQRRLTSPMPGDGSTLGLLPGLPSAMSSKLIDGVPLLSPPLPPASFSGRPANGLVRPKISSKLKLSFRNVTFSSESMGWEGGETACGSAEPSGVRAGKTDIESKADLSYELIPSSPPVHHALLPSSPSLAPPITPRIEPVQPLESPSPIILPSPRMNDIAVGSGAITSAIDALHLVSAQCTPELLRLTPPFLMRRTPSSSPPDTLLTYLSSSSSSSGRSTVRMSDSRSRISFETSASSLNLHPSTLALSRLMKSSSSGGGGILPSLSHSSSSGMGLGLCLPPPLPEFESPTPSEGEGLPSPTLSFGGWGRGGGGSSLLYGSDDLELSMNAPLLAPASPLALDLEEEGGSVDKDYGCPLATEHELEATVPLLSAMSPAYSAYTPSPGPTSSMVLPKRAKHGAPGPTAPNNTPAFAMQWSMAAAGTPLTQRLAELKGIGAPDKIPGLFPAPPPPPPPPHSTPSSLACTPRGLELGDEAAAAVGARRVGDASVGSGWNVERAGLLAIGGQRHREVMIMRSLESVSSSLSSILAEREREWGKIENRSSPVPVLELQGEPRSPGLGLGGGAAVKRISDSPSGCSPKMRNALQAKRTQLVPVAQACSPLLTAYM